MNWLAKPNIYKSSISQFGFIYHPLYQLFDGNIASLRQANIAITFFLANCSAMAALLSVDPRRQLKPIDKFAISSGISCVSLAIFSVWLPTPSYNSLNFQALLLTSTGWILSCSNKTRVSRLGYFIVGAGGWLTFMAKPSSAVVLVLLTFLSWLLAGKLRLSGILISTATSLFLLLTAGVSIDSSFFAFLTRLSSGLEAANMLGSGHSLDNLFRNDSLQPTAFEILLFSLLVLLQIFYHQALTKNHKKWHFVALIVSILLLLTPIFFVISKLFESSNWSQFKGILYFSIPISSLLLSIYNRFRTPRKSSANIEKASIPFFSIPLLSYAYAFGTNNNYWTIITYAAFFWLIPIFLLTRETINREQITRTLLFQVLIGQLITMFILLWGMEHPYRQPQALRLNEHKIEYGRKDSILILSKSQADYITTAQDMAYRAGLIPDTPMIDLSGQSPGVLYALKAHSLGLAWMIGGYPGSTRFAKYALALVPCEELAHAWVLSEPESPRSLPAEVLLGHGANLDAHYRAVGTWAIAAGEASHPPARRQILWKPSRDQALARIACESARRNAR